MDFDLVFDKMREIMRRDKPYQKNLVIIKIYRDTLQKHEKKPQNGKPKNVRTF